MRKLKLAFALSTLLFLASPAWAALPPQSPEALQTASTDVVTGTVLEVDSKIEAVPNGKDRVYTAKVKVEAAEKGTVEPASTITVTFRKTDQRPMGWAGPQGQNQILVKDAEVRLFLKSVDGAYQLLSPNGWEPIAK